MSSLRSRTRLVLPFVSSSVQTGVFPKNTFQLRKTFLKAPVVVVSDEFCREASKLQTILDSLTVHSLQLNLPKEHDERMKALLLLENFTRLRKLPCVFIGGNPIGTLRDVQLLQRKGRLMPLISRAEFFLERDR